MKKIVCDVCGVDMSIGTPPAMGVRGSNGEWIDLVVRADWARLGSADVCHECLIKALTEEAA